MICPACSHELPGGATYCPHCRERGLAGAGPPSPAVTSAPVPAVRAISPGIGADKDPRERLFLILACTLSAGVLAIPRLRQSKAFGPTGKLVLGSIAVLQIVIAVGVVATLPWWFPPFLVWWAHKLGADLPRHY